MLRRRRHRADRHPAGDAVITMTADIAHRCMHEAKARYEYDPSAWNLCALERAESRYLMLVECPYTTQDIVNHINEEARA